MMKSYVDWFLSINRLLFSNIDTSIIPSDVGRRDDSENIKKSISKICGLRLYNIPPAKLYSMIKVNISKISITKCLLYYSQRKNLLAIKTFIACLVHDIDWISLFSTNEFEYYRYILLFLNHRFNLFYL